MNVSEHLKKAVAFFDEHDVPEPLANAEWLMAEALKIGRAQVALQGGRVLNDRQVRHFTNLVKTRGRRIPLAYVIGTQPFMDLVLEVTPEVLIPRPETEELVMEAMGLASGMGRPDLNILEVGTGSGCVAIALARLFPQATVYATELSPTALKLAERNAVKHHVASRIRFVREDLYKPVARHSGWADLVVSNPPYIPSKVVDKLEPEVLKEPRLALDGGPDGLQALKAIIEDAPRHLKRGGYLVLEIGHDQGAAVTLLLSDRGFTGAYVRRDAQGQDRIAVGRW